MNNPKISIITVCFNAVKTIEKTIQSVINQTYNQIEYIIIDGASTDGTLDIIKKYQDRISYWQSEPDKGIYDAMNKGITVAAGEWISFMNAGDKFVDERVVETVSSYLDKVHAVVYGDTINEWSFGYELIKPSKDDVMPFCHQSCFTRSDLLKKYLFDTHYVICADYNFYYTLNKTDQYSKSYVNQPISVFDSVDSLSTANRILLYKERAKIMNMKGIRYYCGLMTSYLRKFIIDLFPSIVNRYRIIRANNR